MVSPGLNAWMNGEWVGTWRVTRGVHSFLYAASWLVSDKYRPLSLSLPLTRTPEITGDLVAHYFDNLLPDNDQIRARIGQRFRTKAVDTFALLQAIGRDCVGAVQLLPEDTTPEGWNRIECIPLTPTGVAETLRTVSSNRWVGDDAGHQPLRISLAGAQEKTALLWAKGQWCSPLGATPSTHIFKLPLGLIANSSRINLFDSVENEWLCAEIIRALGLPVARTAMARFDDQLALIVERFDRQWMEGDQWIARLPQEDFCQALGVSPRLKYEADGGPSVVDGLRLLSASADAPTDQTVFQLAQLAFWLMAAPDGHAKNYSIFLRQGGAYEMTPLYDMLSMWPYVGKKHGQVHSHDLRLAMAMQSKTKHFALNTVRARHWHHLALKNGGPTVWQAMRAMVDRLDSSLDAVETNLPHNFPARIWAPIADGMRRQANLFQTEVDSTGLG